MSRPLKKKQQAEDESLEYVIGIGTYTGFTPVPTDDKPKKKKQIGFVRTECEKPKRKR